MLIYVLFNVELKKVELRMRINKRLLDGTKAGV